MGMNNNYNKTAAVTCCHDCKERFPACHDVCVTYLKEKEAWEEWRRQIREVKDQERIFDKHHYNQVIKRRKKGEKRNHAYKREWVR